MYVEGKLSYRDVEKDGAKRSFTDININDSNGLVVLSSKKDEAAAAEA